MRLLSTINDTLYVETIRGIILCDEADVVFEIYSSYMALSFHDIFIEKQKKPRNSLISEC